MEDVPKPAIRDIPNPLTERCSPSNIQARMSALLICAMALAGGQHALYAYVDGKSVNRHLFPSLPFADGLSNQALVSFLGTQTAKLVVVCLCAAIGVANVQVFWWRLGVRRMTIAEIGAISDFTKQPLNVFTWRTVFSFRLIALVVICRALTDFVSAITPGSIAVLAKSQDARCTVRTVDLAHSRLMPADSNPDNAFAYLNGGLASVIIRAVIAGANFTPSSPCGLCRYNLTFAAPAVRCANVTQTAAFKDAAPAWDEQAGVTVWDAQRTDTDLLVKSRDVVGTRWSPLYNVSVDDLPTVILNCTGWNAVYDVLVNHTVTSTAVTVRNVTYKDRLTDSIMRGVSDWDVPDSVTSQSYALWLLFAYVLEGTLRYRPSDNCVSDTHDYVAHSPLIANPLSSGFTWKWAGNLADLIPQLMWNVNLSILSGELATNSTHSETDVNCRTTRLVFVYSRLRLGTTYGAAFGVALMCVVYGSVATKLSGRGETSGFVRILAAYPGATTDLTPATEVTVGADGRFVPAESTEGST